MHDPTEGGLATGLGELARASGVGLEIQEDVIPFSNEGLQLCAAYALNPLGVIASGSLLLTTPQHLVQATLSAVADVGVECRVIGRAVPLEQGMSLIRGGERLPLPHFSVDEIARLFSEPVQRPPTLA
jgi:hydrogenase maturation factor